MYKIEAAAHFLHLPCGFYIYRAAFTLCRAALNEGAGDPSRPPYYANPSRPFYNYYLCTVATCALHNNSSEEVGHALCAAKNNFI